MPATPDLFRPYSRNKVFVETGSYLGDGIETALNSGYEKVYSIELSPHYYHICSRRFSNQSSRVHLTLGDSSHCLWEIIHDIHEPITFWLDGHWSMGNTAKGDIACPLLRELEIIQAHSVKTHTILIDDMPAWQVENPQYGFGEQDILASLRRINPEYKFFYCDRWGSIKNDGIIGNGQDEILVATL